MKLTAHKNRTFLTLCAAPLLLAMAASASSSSDPTPSPDSTTEGGAAAPTLYPNPTIGYKQTPSPADEEIVADEEAGSSMMGEEEEEGASSTGEEEEEEEGSSMTGSDEEEVPQMGDEPTNGETCTTYDEDVSEWVQVGV